MSRADVQCCAIFKPLVFIGCAVAFMPLLVYKSTLKIPEPQGANSGALALSKFIQHGNQCHSEARNVHDRALVGVSEVVQATGSITLNTLSFLGESQKE
jgi:hypothetical protein